MSLLGELCYLGNLWIWRVDETAENSCLRLEKVGDFYFGLLMEICMGYGARDCPHQDCYALANRISYTQLIFKWHVIPPVCRDAVMFTIFRY